MKWILITTNKIIILLLLIFLLSHSIQAIEIKGVVFEDANRNLKFDKGEKGIANVLVSNQREVVKTNSKGYYSLPIEDETIIFVTKPSGYAVPLNKDNLPQFYYIHRPKGSPQLKYKGIEPTGFLPESLNFPLFKSKESDNFEIIVFSDPQSRKEEEIDFIRDDVIAELIGTNAVFGITLGDIMFDNLSFYDKYNELVAQIGIPFYNVPGNHDQNYDLQDDHYSLETFKSHFGPSYYSFDYGEVHFIVFDDVEWLGTDDKGKSHYRGMIGEKQLQWLNNDLNFVPQNKLIVFTMHIPFYTILSDSESDNVVDKEKLFKLIKDRKYLLALAGHNHTLEHHFLDNNVGWKGISPLHQIICATICGSWFGGPKDERGIPIATQEDGVPNGYHILKFDGNKYSEQYKPASKSSNYQLRISSPIGKIKKDDLKKTRIVVNVFDGSEKSVVECKVDNSPLIKMQRTIMEDPYFQEIHTKFKDSFRSWVEPRKSSHIWTAPLAPDLEPGIHKIFVQTTNQSGNIFKTTQIILVEQ